MTTKGKNMKSIVVTCANCGKQVKKYCSQVAKSKAYYCSRSCYYQAKSKGMSLPDQRGPKNPFWKGGVSSVAKTCSRCGKEFTSSASNKRIYCSEECGYEDKKKRTSQKCLVCGVEFEALISDVERGKAFLCSKECCGKWYSEKYSGENNHRFGIEFSDEHKKKIGDSCRGEKHYGWNGGRKKQNGYVLVLMDDGSYKQEHRIVAEKALGRPFKDNEVVHHINGIRNDNRNCNLLICDTAYHSWLHRRMAAMYQQEHFADALPA